MHKGPVSENPLAVNELTSPKKTTEICRKALLFYFFTILSQTQLEKDSFGQIWDFNTAC